MKSLKLIPAFLVLFVVFVTTHAFSQDESFQETFFVNDDLSIWNECAGENLSGTLPYQINIYYDENGDYTGGVIIPLPCVLFGDITGDEYQAEGGEVMYLESILHGQRTKTEARIRAEVKILFKNSKIIRLKIHKVVKFMAKKGQTIFDSQILSTECY
jgi:hypothetical protein